MDANSLSYREFPVFIPLGGEFLFGIVCVPREQAQDVGVVLLAGSNYNRSHRNRMWARAARALAERGFSSIRIDYHGVGDSTGAAEFALESPFLEDASAAGRFLRRATGVHHLAVVATCFGALSGIAAAAQDPHVISATIFPVPVLLSPSQGALAPRTRVRRLLQRSRTLRALMRRPGLHRVRRKAAARRRSRAISPRLREQVTSFLQRGRIWFVYGERTSSLAELRQLLSEVEPRLTSEQRARLHLEIVEGTELAGFHSLRDQDIAVDRAVETVVRASAAVGGAPVRVGGTLADPADEARGA